MKPSSGICYYPGAASTGLTCPSNDPYMKVGKREEKKDQNSAPLTPSSFKKTIYRTFSEKTWKTLLFFCLLGLIWNTLCTEKYWNWTLHLCKSTPHLQEQYSSFCKILVFIFLFFVKNTNKMKNIICAVRKKESRLSGKIMFPSNYKNCPVSMYLSVLYFFWF